MKGTILVLILIGCGLFYVRSQQPDLWNRLLFAVGMQAPAQASPDAPATASTAAAKDSTAPVGLVPVHPEFITPDSTYMTSEHVHQVEQPVQPGAAAQQTATTATPAAPQ